MKNLKLLSIVIIAISFLVSCEKDKMETGELPDSALLKTSKLQVEIGPSTPISSDGVSPYIIPGDNRGGNRTCEEVASWAISKGWDDPEFIDCGDKVDYDDFVIDGVFDEEGFEAAFGDLNVNLDGRYISFDLGQDCLDGYKVGAVIVKGSNAANVYYYPEGISMDAGLAAPGDQAMVSNLTFCLVECDVEEESVIAVKCQYFDDINDDEEIDEGEIKYAYSTGEIKPFEFNNSWCGVSELEVNKYSSTSNFFLHQGDDVNNVVGEVTVVDDVVIITLNEGYILHYTHLFVGTMNELKENVYTDGCPIHNMLPWLVDNTKANSVGFNL